jgi:HSP20 family protein
LENRNLPGPYNNDFWGDRFFNQLVPRAFNDFFRTGNPGPSVDLHETDHELILHADIPGLNPEDVDITVDEDMVTLKGETKRDETREERGYHLTERRYGSFYRTIPLPVQVKSEQAVARYKDGVLELKMPKNKAAARRGFKPRIESDNNQVQ